MDENRIVKKYKIVDEDGHEWVINYIDRTEAEQNAARLSKRDGVKLFVVEYEAPAIITVRRIPRPD